MIRVLSGFTSKYFMKNEMTKCLTNQLFLIQSSFKCIEKQILKVKIHCSKPHQCQFHFRHQCYHFLNHYLCHHNKHWATRKPCCNIVVNLINTCTTKDKTYSDASFCTELQWQSAKILVVHLAIAWSHVMGRIPCHLQMFGKNWGDHLALLEIEVCLWMTSWGSEGSSSGSSSSPLGH